MAGIFWSVMHFVAFKNTQNMMLVTSFEFRDLSLSWTLKDQFHLSMIFSFILSSSSGASVVAIDNKIEQAMVCTDLKLLVLNVGTAQKPRCLGKD